MLVRPRASFRGAALLLLAAVVVGLLPWAQPAPVLAGSGGTITVPFSSTPPTLDGLCNDSAYTGGVTVPRPGSGDLAKLLLTADDLYICFVETAIGSINHGAEVYVDRNNSSTLDAGDFVVRATLQPAYSAASYNLASSGFTGADPGGWAAQVGAPPGTEFIYSFEFRISRQTMGEWQRSVGLRLALVRAQTEAWPANTTVTAPAAWGDARLLSSGTPSITVRPAMVIPGGSITVNGINFTPGSVQLRFNTTLLDTTPPALADAGGNFSVKLNVPSDATPGLATISACASAFCTSGATLQNASTLLRVVYTLFTVPVEIRLRAFRFLEEARPNEPDWASAQFDNVVTPIFRPDIEGAAYYEFALTSQTPVSAAEPTASAQAGFVLLSTGPHDHPIAHWNSIGPSLSADMQNQATDTAVTLFKLDSLAYGAEDGAGQQVGRVGQQPAKISGLAEFLANGGSLAGAANYTPGQTFSDDNQGAPSTGNLDRTGTVSSPVGLRFDPWSSWAELKQGYGTTYKPFLDALRREAAANWEVELNVESNGIALLRGESYILRYRSGGTPVLSGEGTSLVQTAASGPNGLQITAVSARRGQPTPFEVRVNYGDGSSETTKFVVLENLGSIVYMPLVSRSGSNTQAAPAMLEQAAAPAATPAAEELPAISLQQATPWTPWSVFRAGSDADQRLYRQLRARESPNTASCFSGCGATAWAMLYGWVDVQAEAGRSPWIGRRGIYQVNGGRGTGPATAPLVLDTGVGNMTMEIRGNIGTFCVGSDGPTLPWDMGNAWRYLVGRTSARISTAWIDPIFGNKADDIRRSIVERRTPAVIGTGFFAHYPLAHAYREQSRRVCRVNPFGLGCVWWETEVNRQFRVNQGWEGSGNGWIDYKSWFVGNIFPN